MTDTFDEYAYLEQQVEGNGHAAPEPQADSAPEKPREEKRHRGDDKARSSRDRSSGRDERRSRHRSRSRSRDRTRDRTRDDRDRDRDRDRARDKDRDRSKGDRTRPERPERPERPDRSERSNRDRSRERDDRRSSRHRTRSPPPRREATPPEVRLAREKERELRELERATRTIFAYNLNLKADERDIFNFFSAAGEITDIRLITDRHTRRSKGLAYIEYAKQECVFTALALTGQMMLGQTVMVKPAEAEKNLAWEAQQAAKQNKNAAAEVLGAALGMGAVPGADATASALPPPPSAAAAAMAAAMMAAAGGVVPAPPLPLSVTGFPATLGELEVKQLFEPFGAVASVTIPPAPPGVAPVARVVFHNPADASTAMGHWNGRALLGGVLSVSPAPLAPGEAAAPPPSAAQPPQQELDDEGDVRLSGAAARAALMSRLASSAGLPAPPPASVTASGLPALPGPPPLPPGPTAPAVDAALMHEHGLLGPPSPIPTPCLLLKNMFGPADTVNPGWDSEIADDVRDECSKFGEVLHIHVDPSSKGCVYLKFASVEAAAAARQALHGRFYSGLQILADFQFAQVYSSYFHC